MIFRSDCRGMSLVEQKKLQWAKEKAEIAKLGEVFSSSATEMTTSHRHHHQHQQIERTSIRTYYSNVDLSSTVNQNSNTIADEARNPLTDKKYNGQPFMHHEEIKKYSAKGLDGQQQQESFYSHYDDLNERIRSPSLPPIGRTKISRNHRPVAATTTADEDTSGYLSDSGNNLSSSPDLWQGQERHSRPRMRLPNENRNGISIINNKLPEFTIQDAYGRHREKHLKDDYTHSTKSRRGHTDYEPAIVVAGKQRNDTSTAVNVLADTRGQGRTIAQKTHQPPTNPRSADETDIEHETDFSIPNCYGTPSSSSSDASRDFSISSAYGDAVGYRKTREERAKWGDRGVTVGHFYDPIGKEISKSGPDWLERGPNDNRDSGDESVTSYSFIRGQNVPIDAKTLAERATKRLRALEFQTAIKEQLAERENIRKREIENRRIEERRREEMLREQMETERIHAEYEQRKHREKVEKEMKKQEMMRAALEKAAWEAKLEKEKKKREKGLISVLDREIVESRVELNYSPDIKATSPYCYQLPEKSDGTIQQNMDRPPIQPNEHERFDDGESILIGTPIKFKKKNLGKIKKLIDHADENLEVHVTVPPAADATDDLPDGIALVLQTMPPIASLSLPNDTISLNNLQFAVMLAHQMEHFAPLQMFQQQGTAFPHQSDGVRAPPATAPAKIFGSNDLDSPKPVQSPLQELVKNIEIEPIRVDSPKAPTSCNICGGQQNPTLDQPDVTNENIALQIGTSTTTEDQQSKDEVYSLPHDGTFTKETNTEGPAEPSSEPTITATTVSHTIDVSTQTEEQKRCQSCCCRHHQHRSSDHEAANPTVSAAIVHESNKKNATTSTSRSEVNHQSVGNDVAFYVKTDTDDDYDDDNLNDKEIEKETTTTTTTTTITTLIRSKSKELAPMPKIENRPKWGVNRPLMQYIKASDRDPFYLRNRRKRYQKRSQTEPEYCTISKPAPECDAISSSRSPSPRSPISARLRRRSSQPQLRQLSVPPVPLPRLSRNICTEILPIKTDVNGKIFLNFQDASMVMTENEVKQNLRKRYCKMERIMNRRKTSDEIMNELNAKQVVGDLAAAIRRRSSNRDAIGLTGGSRSLLPREISKRIAVDVDLETC